MGVGVVGRSRRPFIAFAVPAVSAVHAQMEQRAEQQQQKWQPAQHVDAVLSNEQIGKAGPKGRDGQNLEEVNRLSI